MIVTLLPVWKEMIGPTTGGHVVKAHDNSVMEMITKLGNGVKDKYRGQGRICDTDLQDGCSHN